MSRRGTLVTLIAAAFVTLVELGATLSGIGAAPMELVSGWAPTRQGDVWAILLTVGGCGALFALPWLPTTALLTASASYAVFILRDYEFGITLPAMLAIFFVTVRGERRFVPLAAASLCLASTAVWIFMRTVTIIDSGVAMLAWVAFGTVSAVFFFLPAVFGELVRLRRL
ncbi:hypothetical protein, partial [uncultured Agrococcus sp.]|uniref:hypothetical protein n=1 Tax=uncultured Agrococcus sp. TaxID=382258 RepID=UPI0025CF89B7